MGGWTEEDVARVRKKRQQTAQVPVGVKVSRETSKAKAGGFDAFYALLGAAGLPLPEREWVFHLTRKFKADYAWPVQKLIIERQGGVWAKPGTRAKKAHTEPLAILRDYEKSNLAQLAGFTYLQYTPDQLDSGQVIETLRIRLNS